MQVCGRPRGRGVVGEEPSGSAAQPLVRYPPGKDILAAGGSAELPRRRRVGPDCAHGVHGERVIGLPGLTKGQSWHLARLPCSLKDPSRELLGLEA
ncbi:hypothetical protein I79_025962 [Cricetulus griseus]|uniref:Uncharacterized protein n=1 Tax=Cricetulus griseus TaxID=10029 RepID=G3IPP4_CRIGR|nr:hypothetical protein I79_025962 [Cricetulus griseus]